MSCFKRFEMTFFRSMMMLSQSYLHCDVESSRDCRKSVMGNAYLLQKPQAFVSTAVVIDYKENP